MRPCPSAFDSGYRPCRAWGRASRPACWAGTRRGGHILVRSAPRAPTAEGSLQQTRHAPSLTGQEMGRLRAQGGGRARRNSGTSPGSARGLEGRQRRNTGQRCGRTCCLPPRRYGVPAALAPANTSCCCCTHCCPAHVYGSSPLSAMEQGHCDPALTADGAGMNEQSVLWLLVSPSPPTCHYGLRGIFLPSSNTLTSVCVCVSTCLCVHMCVCLGVSLSSGPDRPAPLPARQVGLDSERRPCSTGLCHSVLVANGGPRSHGV